MQINATHGRKDGNRDKHEQPMIKEMKANAPHVRNQHIAV